MWHRPVRNVSQSIIKGTRNSTMSFLAVMKWCNLVIVSSIKVVNYRVNFFVVLGCVWILIVMCWRGLGLLLIEWLSAIVLLFDRVSNVVLGEGLGSAPTLRYKWVWLCNGSSSLIWSLVKLLFQSFFNLLLCYYKLSVFLDRFSLCLSVLFEYSLELVFLLLIARFL
jgi:hypothetical protein